MIPSVTKKGTSFKGAAAYYFHDKQAQTNDRVEFTHTVNLATDNPDMAAKIMAYTAMHQSEIKQAAGGVAKGRKLTQPVYAYSLAWHPSQEPTREQMIASGRDTLKVLGLDGHEAVMAAHNDEAHKHLHIVVNRVHPETGVAAKLSNDRLKLSKWAESYEREQGEILCHKRVENNERRKNRYVKHREKQNKTEYHRWQHTKTKEAFEKRQAEQKDLSSIHKKQREDLHGQKESLIKQRLERINNEQRPKWASIYKQQKAERKEFEQSNRSAFGRLRYYIKNKDRLTSIYDAKGNLSGAFQSVLNKDELSKRLNNRQENERKKFGSYVSDKKAAAYNQINTEYVKQHEILKNRQRDDIRIMQARQAEESKKQAADIKSGRAKEEFGCQKKAQESREAFNKKAKGVQPEAKEEFNKKRDFRVFREMKKEQERKERTSNDNAKKEPGIKREFNEEVDFRVLRYRKKMEEQEERASKGSGLSKEFDTSKEQQEQQKEKDRGHSKDRDMEREM